MIDTKVPAWVALVAGIVGVGAGSLEIVDRIATFFAPKPIAHFAEYPVVEVEIASVLEQSDQITEILRKLGDPSIIDIDRLHSMLEQLNGLDPREHGCSAEQYCFFDELTITFYSVANTSPNSLSGVLLSLEEFEYASLEISADYLETGEWYIGETEDRLTCIFDAWGGADECLATKLGDLSYEPTQTLRPRGFFAIPVHASVSLFMQDEKQFEFPVKVNELGTASALVPVSYHVSGTRTEAERIADYLTYKSSTLMIGG